MTLPPPDQDEPILPPPDDGEGESDLPESLLSDAPITDAGRSLDDLTLAETLGLFLRSPFRTARAVQEIASDSASQMIPVQRAAHEPDQITQTLNMMGFSLLLVIALNIGAVLTLQALQGRNWVVLLFLVALTLSTGMSTLVGLKSALGASGNIITRFRQELPLSMRRWLRLGLWLGATATGFIGAVMMIQGYPRTPDGQLTDGAPYIAAAFFVWLIAEMWLGEAFIPRVTERTEAFPAWSWSLNSVRRMSRMRVVALVLTVILGLIAFQETRGNHFRASGFYAWVGSIITVLVLVAPKAWSVGHWRANWATWNARRLERIRARLGDGKINWVVVLFWVIMAVGIVFRVYDLNGTPSQMTSDHKEKMEDAYNITQGLHLVFFTDNGGREGFQMYAMALFAQLPGMGFNHRTLMLLAVIESVLTLPVMFWLGRQVGGRDRPEFGNWLGLVLMGFVAVSYWHLAITRLALRIVLTPLVGAALMGFLIRGMRDNRRSDFIYGGLVLGVGLFMYQAVRIMPLLVLAGVGIAILAHWRDGRTVRRYITHLAVLVVVSFVVFVPLLRFSIEEPDLFWLRSAGRLFGDSVVQTTDEQGNITLRQPTIEERLSAFGDNLPQLTDNIRNALLMFYWKGDEGWINGEPFQPELDPLAGTLLVVGLVTSLALYWRTRDEVFIFIPVAVVVMLLASALSIARANENPSATRASGAIPPVFLLTSIAVLAIATTLREISRRWGTLIAGGAVTGFLMVSLTFNWNLYYVKYHHTYMYRTWPYSIPGDVLKGFVLEGNPPGNAFMIFTNLWWDYTILGMEAGLVDWPNGLVDVEDLPALMNNLHYCPRTPYPVDPTQDLLIFYHYADEMTELRLYTWFPNGYSRLIETYNSPNYDFRIFRVPAMGEQAFYDWSVVNVESPLCGPTPPLPPEQAGAAD